MTDVLNHNGMERSYRGPTKADIQKYDERLSKRREKQREEQRLNDFLQSSLRGSERLRSLEDRTRHIAAPEINRAFEEDQDETINELTDFDVTRLTEAVCGRRNVRNAIPKSDLDWLLKTVGHNQFQTNYYSCTEIPRILCRHDNNNREIHLCESGNNTIQSINGQINNLLTSPSKRVNAGFKFQVEELSELIRPDSYLHEFIDAVTQCAEVTLAQQEARHHENAQLSNVPGISVDSSISSTPTPKKRHAPKESPQMRPHSNDLPPVIKTIKSRLPNCYAQIHDTESGVPIRTVVLEKDNKPLGATVRNDRDAIIVGRIVVGGIAEKSGLLQEGDELLSVNSIELTGKDVNEVSDIFSRITGILHFTVTNQEAHFTLSRQHKDNEKIHLRALFSYEPQDDAYIPCKEIGLSFNVGDILHVTDVHDPNWWQAFRDDGQGSGPYGDLAGLIPSPTYQFNREKLRIDLCLDDSAIDNEKKNKKNKKQTATVNGWIYNVDQMGLNSDGHRKQKKRGGKSSTYYPSEFEGTNQQYSSINTYEEVQMYLPQPRRKRPIVIVGPELIGRHELIKMIVDSNSDISLVKKHTTNSVPNSEYESITFDVFKHMLNMEEFIETAKFQDNYYGTSKEKVKQLVESGKTPILVLQPESLIAMRSTLLIPYVIFICPPTKISDLRNLRMQLDNVRPSDQELHETIMHAKAIQTRFGHLFDDEVNFTTLDDALRQIMELYQKLQRDAKYVPIHWLKGGGIKSRPNSSINII